MDLFRPIAFDANAQFEKRLWDSDQNYGKAHSSDDFGGLTWRKSANSTSLYRPLCVEHFEYVKGRSGLAGAGGGLGFVSITVRIAKNPDSPNSLHLECNQECRLDIHSLGTMRYNSDIYRWH